MVEIHENYKVFVPPPWFRPTVERLLGSLGPEHVGGLQSIVLTDGASIGRGKTRRVGGRKFERNQCRGFYHREWQGSRAWIQVVTDNVVAECTPGYMWFQLFRDFVVSETLYHEIGHHLHETVGSATRGGEDAAEYWRKRLSKIHFRRRYWYLVPVLRVLSPLRRLCLRLAQTRA